MKIALDLRRIKNPGIGRYMRCLTHALLALSADHEYLLILLPDAANMIEIPSAARAEKIISRARYYSLREQVEIPRLLRDHRVDVLHAPHFNVPLICSCARVVTIHDVIYLACQEDLPSWAGRTYYRAMMSAAVRVADEIITDSEFSKDQIRQFLGTDRDIRVIYPGADPSFAPIADDARIRLARARYGIHGDYVLYTGIFKPRKNHAGLLRAFRRLTELGVEASLVIAGPMGEGQKDLRQLADGLKIADRVVFTGFVNDCDLPGLYSGARVYACPSLYEGFGLTVLEAMACGTPVVCSSETSLPEVCGAAALYADARNAKEFGDALYKVFVDNNLRITLRSSGFANARRFSWEHTATQTLDVYQRAFSASMKAVVRSEASGGARDDYVARKEGAQ